jgi:hypothetical protein
MGIDRLIHRHYLRPDRRFERGLFALLERHGFDYRACNRLGVPTVLYEMADTRATGDLRDWVPAWCVCQAVYPRVSRDLRGLPIRTLYFDGTPLDLERELDLYLDLARTYRRRTGATRPPAAPLSPFHHRAG